LNISLKKNVANYLNAYNYRMHSHAEHGNENTSRAL